MIWERLSASWIKLAVRTSPRLDSSGSFTSGAPTLGLLTPWLRFFQWPRRGLVEDFARGATAPEVCNLTVSALWNLGIRNIYISHLPVYGAPVLLKEVLRLATDATPSQA